MRARKTLVAAAAALMTVGLVAPAQAAVPENDEFENATPIEGQRFRDQTVTITATASEDDPDCYGNQKSVWYSYTAREDSVVYIDTYGSNYDTTLSAWRGNPTRLERVACFDEWAGTEALQDVPVEAGQTVYFMVASCCSDATGGLLTVNARIEIAPLEAKLTVTRTGIVNEGSGEAIVRGELTCDRDDYVVVSGRIRQRLERGESVIGYFEDKLYCDEGKEETWFATADPGNGAFEAGRAGLDVSLRSQTGQGRRHTTVDRERADVRLKGCTVVGTSRADRLEGTPRADIVCGLGGNDVLIGKGGDDELVGGPDRDRVLGSDGDDLLFGGPGEGSDFMSGGDGHDTCRTGSKRDRVEECETIKG